MFRTQFIGHSSPNSAVFVAIAAISCGVVVGCSETSDARLNSVFSPSQTFGPTGDDLLAREPAFDDHISSRVLDQKESEEVITILESVVQGEVLPMRPAIHGIRFEDSPMAMTSAAKIMEMGVLSEAHEWPQVKFTLISEEGVSVPLLVTIRGGTPLVTPSISNVDSETRRLHAELAAAMTRALIRSNVDDVLDVEEVGRKVISTMGMDLFAIEVIPEKYVFDLIMLNGQSAQLIVTRESLPEIASWKAQAGLFNDAQIRASLEKVFASEMRAWGRILRPTKVE